MSPSPMWRSPPSRATSRCRFRAPPSTRVPATSPSRCSTHRTTCRWDVGSSTCPNVGRPSHCCHSASCRTKAAGYAFRTMRWPWTIHARSLPAVPACCACSCVKTETPRHCASPSKPEHAPRGWTSRWSTVRHWPRARVMPTRSC